MGLIITGIVFIIIGVYIIINAPITTHKSWKTNYEPSRLEIWSMRLGGIVMTVVGIGVIVLFFF